jgi:hypothetical protein
MNHDVDAGHDPMPGAARRTFGQAVEYAMELCRRGIDVVIAANGTLQFPIRLGPPPKDQRPVLSTVWHRTLSRPLRRTLNLGPTVHLE